MSFLTSTLGRYLIARTLASIALVLGVICASLVLFDLVEQMRTVGTRSSLSVIGALGLALMRLPSLIEATLPLTVLVGTMMALFQLNRRSELVAIRASGVSAWKFLSPAVTLAAAIGLFGAMVLNPVGAALSERYEGIRDQLIGVAAPAQTNEPVWLRQGDEHSQTVITATSVDAQRSSLEAPVFLVFDVLQNGALSFSRRLSARTAELRDGFWLLSDVVEATPGAPPVRSEALSLPTTIDSDALIARFVSPTSLSFWSLPGFITEARSAGTVATSYELRFLSLLTLPLLLAAMAMLGGAFTLRLQRLGGVATWMLSGLGAGIALFFALKMSTAFASADILPPLMAVLTPPISGAFAAMALLSHLEDG